MKETDNQPSKALIARGKAGEEAALVAIYQWYRPKIQRFLHYRLRHRQTAEDLTTEVFLRMLKHLPDYRLQGGTFQGWLFQIARNLVVDQFRRQSVRDHEPIDENLEADIIPPEDVAHHQMLSLEIREAFQELTEGQLDVISLRFIAELSIADVAQALNKSESAVKSLQARGLRTLQLCLTREKVQ